MKTVRRLLYREIFQAVGFVALGFLALFLFFDLVEELQNLTRLGQQGYRIQHAFLMIATKIPGHLYDLVPISVLIGTIFVMARLAQSSEFTILRSGGLGPGRALGMLLKLGWVFALVTLLLGDYASPWAEQQGQMLKARFRGDLTTGRTGAWLKEKQGDQQFAINVRALGKEGRMLNVHIQRFNAQGELQGSLQARQAEFDTSAWLLEDVEEMNIRVQGDKVSMQKQHLAQLRWPTDISRDMVGAALISAERMRIWDPAITPPNTWVAIWPERKCR